MKIVHRLFDYVFWVIFLFSIPASAQVRAENISADGMIIRVTQEGLSSGLACGLDWMAPCNLQHALLNRAAAGDEIWVKAGTYIPSGGSDALNSFLLPSDVGVYGGFNGNETSRDQRDVDSNHSTLEGLTDIYHRIRVVKAKLTGENTILDGFEITGDGCILNENGRLIIRNTIIRDNNFGGNGGGLENYKGHVALENVKFLNNTADNGGAIFNWMNGSMEINNVIFKGNSAPQGYGGVMWNESFSVLDMENVSFIGNSAESGGAIFNDESTTRITNSIFFANSATDLGGAIVNSFGSTVILTNVTFNENTGINPGVSVYNSFSHLSIRNSILWDIQQAPIFDDHSFSLNVSFSDVYGGFAGPGNINADPYLGMPGLFGGFTETIPLSESGPVIDGVPVTECKKPDGSPLTIDQRGVSRPQAFGCDMGAFEVVDTQGIWIANTGLQVKTNMPVVITRDYLRLDDGNSAPEKLVYTISHLPAFGRLRLNGQDLKVADSFTQADVDARKLMYLNDGDSGPDGFGFLYSGPGYLAIERVSVGSGGIQVNAASWNAQMSGDGQYVVFESKAQNIVSQDTDGQDLIYLRDRWADQTCMVSAAEDGTAAQRVSGEVCKWDTV